MARNKLVELADELEQVMDLRARVEAEVDPIKEREEKVREMLTKELIKKGFQYIRTTSGLGFGLVAGRTTFAIKKHPGMRERAIEWVKDHYPAALSVASADLNKILKPMLEVPEFFERKQGEPHLSVRTQEE